MYCVLDFLQMQAKFIIIYVKTNREVQVSDAINCRVKNIFIVIT